MYRLCRVCSSCSRRIREEDRNGATELQAGRQLESDPVGSDYDRLLEKFVTRKRAYGRTLDLNLDLAAVEASICYSKEECTHPYLFNWDGVIFCCDCREELNTPSAFFFGGRVPKPEYALRLAQEEKIIENTPDDVIPEGLSEDEKMKFIGKNSQMRGVKIGFLLELTKKYGCFNWTSHDVIRKIVKPMTESTRCRFVELPEMRDHVGPASTFISYAQAGRWGDLIAAVMDGGADLERCVWLDVFAVRQFPSRCPDLDFASTIAHCKSFMVVCSALKELEEIDTFDMFSGNIYALPEDIRRKICFMRVWCLVEAQQACKMGIPFIMKCGSYTLDDEGEVVFKGNSKALHKMSYLVDVSKAEASVASDRERILKSIEAGVGAEKLNSTIRGSVISSYALCDKSSSSIASCAACGDQDALQMVLQHEGNIVDVSGLGFLNLIRTFIEQEADVGVQDNDGETALMYASEGGHIECVKYLVEYGKADVGVQDNNGMTALIAASAGGHIECVKYLIEYGKADVGVQSNSGLTALIFAEEKGFMEISQYLKSMGAK